MSIRLRTKKLIYAGLIGAGIMLVISSTAGFIYYRHLHAKEESFQKDYETKMTELNNWAEQNMTGYSLVKDVKQGDLITSDMVKEVAIAPNAAASDLLDLQKLEADEYYAKTDLKANTLIAESLVYKDAPLTNDTREAEYSVVQIQDNVKKGSFVDIRIQFPNGDDYIILSKKKVLGIKGITLRTQLDEGEILMMSSAIVDAYLEDAKIYAIPYVDGYMQTSSIVTYPVKSNVRKLIEESPNIVNIAKYNLEKQNRARLESGVKGLSDAEKSKYREGENLTKNEESAANEKAKEETSNEEKVENLDDLNQEDIVNDN